MKKLLRNLMVVTMLGVASAGAFAQKRGEQDKRPPKEPVKVVEKKENRPPPQQNSNQPKHDNRKKP
jgi:hypothetical protein